MITQRKKNSVLIDCARVWIRIHLRYRLFLIAKFDPQSFTVPGTRSVQTSLTQNCLKLTIP
jgi:hypothetical protein